MKPKKRKSKTTSTPQDQEDPWWKLLAENPGGIYVTPLPETTPPGYEPLGGILAFSPQESNFLNDLAVRYHYAGRAERKEAPARNTKRDAAIVHLRDVDKLKWTAIPMALVRINPAWKVTQEAARKAYREAKKTLK